MTDIWTGYGVCTFPVDPGKPCRWIEINPNQLPTLEDGKKLADAIWSNSGSGRDYSQVVVDRWSKGKIVEARCYVIEVAPLQKEKS